MSKRRNKRNNLSELVILLCMIIVTGIAGYFGIGTADPSEANSANTINKSNLTSINLENIPEYNQKPYIEINNNIPSFNEDERRTKAFETYSKLDSLGRCGVAYANICKEIMPTNDETMENWQEKQHK